MNGTYTLSAWVKSTGGQNVLNLYAKNYGGSERKAIIDTSSSIPNWTRYTVDNIQVTNGQIEIGIWSNANPNNWTAIDDVMLIRK